MDRYKDRFNDNFAHNRVEVGLRNQITVRDLAGSPAFTMLVGFAILLIVAVIIYLWIVWDMLLQSLILLLVFGSVLLLIWHGVMSAIRSAAKTHATVTYYRTQNLRNNVIETEHGPVLYDPMRQYRAAVENREVIKERHYAGALGAPADQDDFAAEPDSSWSEIFKNRRRQERAYEADA